MSESKQGKSIDEQLAEVTLEEKRADLKIKRAKLKELEDAEEKQIMTAEEREAALADFNAKQDGEKYNCTHMKGGMDGEGKYSTGDDNKNHCVLINRDPVGTRFVLCSRCQSCWFPGDTREKWVGGSAAAYYSKKRVYVRNPNGKSYEDALKMAAQSNNRAMSGITFDIVRNTPQISA